MIKNNHISHLNIFKNGSKITRGDQEGYILIIYLSKNAVNKIIFELNIFHLFRTRDGHDQSLINN